MSAAILAVGAISPLGDGDAAYSPGEVGEPARVVIAHDPLLDSAGLARPLAARVALDEPSVDRATTLLAHALGGCARALDVCRPGWRAERVGVAIGTSSGGMLSAERAFDAHARGLPIPRELARAATYFAPLEAALARSGVRPAEVTQILGACAASTLAVGVGARWLELDRCDVVLAGGYDALSVFVAAGFEALGATSSTRPRPFRLGRDGMALSEGAAVVALVGAGDLRGARARGFVAGFGASTDAVHITAPDRTGAGLARAAGRALRDAEVAPGRVDLVSAHATATPFNDAAEASALRAVLGDVRPVVHPFKAQIGHALGAAGILETLAAGECLARGLAPAAAGEGETDPSCDGVVLLARGEARASEVALKLSAAFGGANAALVLTRAPPPSRPRPGRRVYLRATAAVTSALDGATLAAALGIAASKIGRIDRLGRLALGAVLALASDVGRDALAGAGIIVGHALATLETNDLYDARRRSHGARHVEARRFPATSPNAVPGECAIAFGLTGPGFGVGASLHGGVEALSVARDLVAGGDAPRMVVVAADAGGAISRAVLQAAGWPTIDDGACAALLTTDPEGALAELPALPVPPAPPAGPVGWRELSEALAALARSA